MIAYNCRRINGKSLNTRHHEEKWNGDGNVSGREFTARTRTITDAVLTVETF